MGKYFDELKIGDCITHRIGKTITEGEHMLFCAMTLNTQPLHINADFAEQSIFGKPLVNGLFTLSLAVGMTVSDLTEGTLVANLAYEHIEHPKPMFHGDTLYVYSQVLEKRDSNSNSSRGIVKFEHLGKNQHGELVLRVIRTALMLKKPALHLL